MEKLEKYIREEMERAQNDYNSNKKYGINSYASGYEIGRRDMCFEILQFLNEPATNK